MTLPLLRNTGQIFVDCFSTGISLLFFSQLELDYRFWGGKQQLGDNFITSHQGYILLTWLTTVDNNLDHQVEVVFDMFLHCKVTL